MGANTAVFSLVSAVLIRKLPFSNPDEIMVLRGTNLKKGWDMSLVSPADFADWKDQNHVFDQTAAWEGKFYTLAGVDEPEQIWSHRGSEDFFSLLGAKPVLGRRFLPEDYQLDGERVVILSHRLWQRRFGVDPGVIGRTLVLDGETYTVVGVMAASFTLSLGEVAALAPELWVPLRLGAQELSDRENARLVLLGRLRPGVTKEQAQAEMSTIAQRLERQYPATNSGLGITIVPLYEQVVQNARSSFLILLGAVAFVLLIACANVANLLMIRSMNRQREMAVRASLGAGPLHLARQLLAEGLLLAGLGAALGLVLASFTVRAMISLIPDKLMVPRLDQVDIDGSVLLFTFLLSVTTGILFGLAPCLGIFRINLSEALKQGTNPATRSVTGSRVRGLLVVSEIALALVLLIGASLMIQSYWHLQRVNPGLNRDNLLAVRIPLPQYKYSQAEQRTAFYQQALQRIGRLPGVKSVSLVNTLPLSGSPLISINFSLEGELSSSAKANPAVFHAISPDYFRTMGIALQQGRLFNEADSVDAPKVAIVSESMQRLFWPAENPIGKRIKVGGPKSGNPWITVVGVVGDVKQKGLSVQPGPTMYWPFVQYLGPTFFVNVVVRTVSNPMSLASMIRDEVRSLDKDQPILEMRTMNQVISESVWRPRFSALLLSIFAVLALLLAALGVYGVISYSVSRQVREIGIRIALGAEPRNVVNLMVRQGMMLAVLGIGIGLAGGLVLTRVLSALLFGVSHTDVATFVAVSLVLAIVSLVACYIPARRATRVDPLVALRYE
jgi:putative ABC transport system permease protein